MFSPRLSLAVARVAALTFAVVNCALVAHAQPGTARGGAPAVSNSQTVTSGSLAGAIQSSERTQNADGLLYTYGQAATTPELARAAIGQLLSDYYKLRNQAQTADQATQAVSEAMLRFMVLQAAQNQILVQQNQQLLDQQARIIELMEAQTKTAGTPTIRR